MTANLNDLPIIERMTASRPAAPVWYQGRLVSQEEAAKLKAKTPAAVSIEGMIQHEIINRLTSARSGQSAPTNNHPEDVAGEFVPGVGFVRYDYND